MILKQMVVMSLMVNLTLEELEEKGKNKNDFKWKLNLKNSNLIPVLQLFKNGKIYENIEATEFSEILQDILKEVQYICDSKVRDEFSALLKMRNNECNKCKLRKICNLKE
ncbi:hypothetical protein LCGC14_0540250 [marine sediment metagenome]|uniref:Uncharacterized protein n=1 Tax=marine sediment metagenome TaxID=412755 RepID=A0A0F9V190_9ZZZZ